MSNDDTALSELSPDWVAIRKKAIEDPLYLNYAILNRDLMRTPAPHHVEASEVLLAEQDALVLAPRGHIKTTFEIVGGAIHLGLKYPNSRHLIIHETLGGSQAILHEIKGHFTDNPKFRFFFPEYAVDRRDESGNQYSFTFPCRSLPSKEASIEVGGIGASKVGRHYDKISVTDAVSEANVYPYATREVMDKVWAYFQSLPPLLDFVRPLPTGVKNAHMLVEGTRWDYDDLYGKMLRQGSGYEKFRKIVYSCWLDDAKTIPLWPQAGFTAEKLREIAARMGPRLFSALYENNPQADSPMNFRREYFRYYDREPQDLDVWITIDPAIKEKETADESAVIMSGVDPNEDLFILHEKAFRVSPYKLVAYVLDLYEFAVKTYGNCAIGVEEVAFQAALLDIFDREAKRRGYAPSLAPLRSFGQDKARRAVPLLFHAERRGIFVRPGMEDMIEEFTRFGSTERDHRVDAAAYRMQVWRAAKRRMSELFVPQTLDLSYWTVKGGDAIKRMDRPPLGKLHKVLALG